MIPETKEKLTFAGGVLVGVAATVALILLGAMLWGCSTYGQIPYSGPEFNKPYVRWFLFIDNSRKYALDDASIDRRVGGVLWTHNPTDLPQRVTVTCRAWEATPTRDLCLLPKHTLQTQLYAFERDRLDPDLCQVVRSQEGCQ